MSPSTICAGGRRTAGCGARGGRSFDRVGEAQVALDVAGVGQRDRAGLGLAGLDLATFRMAQAVLLFVCFRLPAVTMLPRLADVELKFAPEPTAIIAASRRANRTPTIFWGEACQTAANRCMEEPFTEGLPPRWMASTAGDGGGIDPVDGALEARWTDVRKLRVSLKPGAQTGMPQSGNQRSSSGSIGSSAPIWAFRRSSRSESRCWPPPAGTKG